MVNSSVFADDFSTPESNRITVIHSVIHSVVAIYGQDPSAGGGSGVLIDPSGLTLTNFHVVEAEGKQGLAGLADGKLYPWRLVGIDPGGDLALIQLTGRNDFPTAQFADSDSVRPGDSVLAMGNPFALAEDHSPSVTLGIVSATHRYQAGADPDNTLLLYGNCFQVDTSINPGNSGGPLFNIHGKLIGINGRASFEERGRVNVGLGYAVTANQARRFLGDLLATKIAQHATLDATFINQADQVICDAIDLDRSPLAPHGLLPGDQLISFNNVIIDSANTYLNELSTLPANWPVQVIWKRGAAVSSSSNGDAESRASVRLNPVRYTQPPPDPDNPTAEPPGKPGEVQNPTLNTELAKLLLQRHPTLANQTFTDAAILGSDSAGGQPVIAIQLQTDSGTQIVQLSLYQPVTQTPPPNDFQLAPGESPWRPAIDLANQRVVKLYGAGLGREHGYATGILISPDGLILTAIGIYLSGDSITAVLPDGSSHPAQLLRRDNDMQVALLKIDADTLDYFDLTDASPAQPADPVIAISNAFNVAGPAEPLAATLGILSLRADLHTMKRTMDSDLAGEILLLDAVISSPGSPGGPVVDLDARLVGIIGKILEAKSTRTRLNYAIPADRLLKFVSDQSHKSPQPTVTEQQLPGAEDLGIRIFTLGGRDTPAYIDSVIPNSPADSAGLKRDDLILSINDQPVRNLAEYQQLAATLPANQPLTLLIKRNNEILTLTLTPEAGQ